MSQVSPIHRESSLRTLRNAHFRREEVLHDEGQLFAMYPKNFPQVSPIDRVLQLHFSTLEKTKIDHNPFVNNLILTFQRVAPFYRQEHVFLLIGFDEAEEDTNEGVLAVKFIIGRDLAVTRPSPDSC